MERNDPTSPMESLSMEDSATSGQGTSNSRITPPSQRTSSSSSTTTGTQSVRTQSNPPLATVHNQQQFSAPSTNSNLIPRDHQRFHVTQVPQGHHGIPGAINLHQPSLAQPSHSSHSSHSGTSSVTSVFLPPQFPQDRVTTLENELRNTVNRVATMEQRMAQNHQQLLQAINNITATNHSPNNFHHHSQSSHPHGLPNQTNPYHVRHHPIPNPSPSTTYIPHPHHNPTPTSAPSPLRAQSTAPPMTPPLPQTIPTSIVTPITASHPSSMKLELEPLSKQIRSTVRKYENWRASTIRKIAINHNTKHAVDITVGELRTQIDPWVKLFIYDALATAILPDSTTLYISAQEAKVNDVYALLNNLDINFGKSSTTSLTNLQHSKEFTNISKRDREDMDTYFARFKEAMVKAKSTLTGQDLAVHFITSLHNSIFNQTVLDIADNVRPDWWKHGLENTFHRAKEHIRRTTAQPGSRPIRDTIQAPNPPGNGNNPPSDDNRLENVKRQLKEWFPQRPTKDALLAKSKSFGHKCPKHRTVSSHSLLACNLFTKGATELGWTTVWKTAFEEDNRRRTEAIQANQGGNTTNGSQGETTSNTNGNQQNNSSNSNNTNSNVTGYLATARKIKIATTPTISPDQAQTQQSPRQPKRKWSHFPPKPPKATTIAKAAPLPTPTPEEENYLQNTTRCWDVVARTVGVDQQHIIPDSGCRHHITHEKSDFIDLHTFEADDRPYVKMADDQTHLPISGYGTIQLQMRDKQVRLAALYVPTMKTRLFSVSQHIQYKGCAFLAANNKAHITFPLFIIDVDNTDEFKVPVYQSISHQAHFDEEHAELVEDSPMQTNYQTTIDTDLVTNRGLLTTDTVYFKKLVPSAIIPTRGTDQSAGLDLASIENAVIAPGETKCIKTGLACQYTEGMYLRIAPRSGNALKGIIVNGGVVDRDYRGDIGVILHNTSTVPFTVTQGQHIAQGIFEKLGQPQVIVTNTLSPTSRNSNGFGSTDRNTNKRVQICDFGPGATFQLDRTRGKHKVRVRRMPSSILKNHQITQPPSYTTTKSTIIDHDPATVDAHDTYDTRNTQRKPTSTPPQPPTTTDTIEDWMIPVEDIPEKPPQEAPDPSIDDDDESMVDEVYTDFEPEGATANTYRRRTACQRTAPIDTNPMETNIDPDTSRLHPIDSETDLRNADTAPRVQIEDRPNSALPKRLNISKDRLLQSIGYLDTDRLIKLLPKLVKENTIHIQTDHSPTTSPGQTATMNNTKRPQTQVKLPPKFGDIWHVDIGFGPSKAIGGARYCLFFVDSKTRYKHVFPLQNLTDNLVTAMNKFITKVGRAHIGELLTDFDEKLIGGEVRKLLDDEHIPISAAPPRRQSQNGLVESHWKNIVKMARNWLRASLLPANFWWFAIKRAVEITNNLLPSYHMDPKNPKTPFEYVYNKKPDPRNLIPLFSIADIKIDRKKGGAHRNKWESQSLRCITVGLSPKANCVMFYHPPTKQIIHSPTYRFDTFLPAGPQFNLQFDADFMFNTRADLENSRHRPPSHECNTKVYVTLDDNTEQGTVIETPINENTDPFVIQLDSNDIIEVMTEHISETDPTATPSDIPPTTSNPPHLPWITDGAKVTLVPPGAEAPKQGYLIHSKTVPGEWEFVIGRKKTNPSIPLPQFEQDIHSLLENRKLFKGWKNLRLASTARLLRGISNAYCRHVSAKGLTKLSAPSLLKHKELPDIDKALWDEAYKEEYEGLQKLGTWKAVTDEEYDELKKVIKAKFLPTMAISTIKYDGDGKPNRCKYRIVALGNLDPHNWSKQDCFAPVLSQMEHRTLIALAVRNGCIPKTGDVSQAFCQGILPDDEEYYIKPPPGCPLTKKGGYLKLLKTLYGLKRSPRHWYEKAKKVLQNIGFVQCPNAPCLFVGTLIQGQPPVYLGLYVDDFVYFSKSKAAEKLFEKKFSAQVNVDFSGQIGYFLGINHRIQQHDDGHITVYLNQEAFIDALAQQHDLHGDHVNNELTPYKSGLPVDKIKPTQYTTAKQAHLTQKFQSIVGSLNWLSTSTRPDIATITNILAKYSSCPTEGHVAHAKHVIKYLKGTKTKGISFSSTDNDTLQSFVKFPIPSDRLTALTDANWGPQDQSKPHPTVETQLELFKTRSLSGYLIWLGGPLHWSAKRQGITARSSAEAEIYATDECVKQLQHLHHIIQDLGVIDILMPGTTNVYNDNSASVYWAQSMTTKGLRHIQIRENAIREAVQKKFVNVLHIAGAVNLADLFTKEQKNPQHFITLRDIIMSDCEIQTNIENKQEGRRQRNKITPRSLRDQGGDQVMRPPQAPGSSFLS